MSTVRCDQCSTDVDVAEHDGNMVITHKHRDGSSCGVIAPSEKAVREMWASKSKDITHVLAEALHRWGEIDPMYQTNTIDAIEYAMTEEHGRAARFKNLLSKTDRVEYVREITKDAEMCAESLSAAVMLMKAISIALKAGEIRIEIIRKRG